MMLSLRAAAVAVVAAVWACGPALAQVEDEAKALLNDSAKALADLKSVSFKSHKYIEGAFKGMLDVEGEVKLIRSVADKNKAPQWMTGKTKVGAIEETFTVSLDNGTVAWVDVPNKKVVEASLTDRSEAFSQVSTAQQLLPDEYLTPDPYKQALTTAESLRVTEGKEVGGVPCSVVHAVYPGGKREVVYSLGMTDKLPRKIELIAAADDVTMVLELSDVQADPGLKASDLVVAVPEGYQREVRQAPVDPNVAAKPAEPVGPPPPPPVLGVAPGQEAPPFELATPAGEQVTLERLRGNVVVLEFFATPMAASKKASPEIQKIADQFKGKNVRIYGVACRERKEGDAVEYQKSLDLTYGLLLNGDEVAKSYQVKGFPSFAVIGTDGKMVEFIQGASQAGWSDKLSAAVQRAVEQSEGTR